MRFAPRQKPITIKTQSSTAVTINMDPYPKVNCPACPKIKFFRISLRPCQYHSTLTVSSHITIRIQKTNKQSSDKLTSRRRDRSMLQRPVTNIKSSAVRTIIDCPTPTSTNSNNFVRTQRVNQRKMRTFLLAVT